MIELQPKRYQLFTDIVAASIPATTKPRTPDGRMRARSIGIACIESCPGPRIVRAAMPHSIGIMPRPKKTNPVQVYTRLPTSEVIEENIRIAVVCQQILIASQNKI